MLAAPALCALMLGAPSAPAPPQTAAPGAERIDAQTARRVPFPTPPRALTLAWEGDGPSVLALLEAYARATGRLVLMTDKTREIVRDQVATTAPGTSRLDVSPADVHAVFETLLRAHDLVLSEAFEGTSRSAVRVTSLRTGPWEVAALAVHEPLERIEAYRGHPAVLIATWVPVADEGDALRLATALRAALGKPELHLQRFAPTGSGLALRSWGPDVCRIVDFVHEVQALRVAGETFDDESMKALVDERFPRPADEPTDHENLKALVEERLERIPPPAEEPK